MIDFDRRNEFMTSFSARRPRPHRRRLEKFWTAAGCRIGDGNPPGFLDTCPEPRREWFVSPQAHSAQPRSSLTAIRPHSRSQSLIVMQLVEDQGDAVPTFLPAFAMYENNL
jgi:hypothetical protein